MAGREPLKTCAVPSHCDRPRRTTAAVLALTRRSGQVRASSRVRTHRRTGRRYGKRPAYLPVPREEMASDQLRLGTFWPRRQGRKPGPGVPASESAPGPTFRLRCRSSAYPGRAGRQGGGYNGGVEKISGWCGYSSPCVRAGCCRSRERTHGTSLEPSGRCRVGAASPTAWAALRGWTACPIPVPY